MLQRIIDFSLDELPRLTGLELVRLGVKSPNDPHITSTLKAVDSTLRLGDQFYRRSKDGYGETATGGVFFVTCRSFDNRSINCSSVARSLPSRFTRDPAWPPAPIVITG